MMKKTILGISFLLMAAFAGSASAQSKAEKCQDNDKCKQEQCDKKDCDKKECAKKECTKKDCDKKDCDKKDCTKKECKQNGVENGRKGPYCRIPSPRSAEGPECRQEGCGMMQQMFADINLSEDQKVKIDDLEKAMKASRKEAMQSLKSEEKKVTREEIKDSEKTLRTKYLADLKNILSPDQYTQFLQNFFVNQSPVNPQMRAHGRMGQSAEKMEKKLEMKEKAVVDKKKEAKKK